MSVLAGAPATVVAVVVVVVTVPGGSVYMVEQREGEEWVPTE